MEIHGLAVQRQRLAVNGHTVHLLLDGYLSLRAVRRVDWFGNARASKAKREADTLRTLLERLT